MADILILRSVVTLSICTGLSRRIQLSSVYEFVGSRRLAVLVTLVVTCSPLKCTISDDSVCLSSVALEPAPIRVFPGRLGLLCSGRFKVLLPGDRSGNA